MVRDRRSGVRLFGLMPFGSWGLSGGFVLLLAGLTAFQIHGSHDRTVRLAGESLSSIARIAEEDVRGRLNTLRLRLEAAAVAAVAAAGPDGLPDAGVLADGLQGIPDLQAAFLTSGSGAVIAATEPWIAARALVGDSPLEEARATVAAGAMHLSPPRPFGPAARLAVIAAVPLPGLPGGLAAVALDPATFLRVLQTVHTREPGAGALLLTPEGDIISRDPDPALYTGRNIASGPAFAFHRAAGTQASTLTHVTATDGEAKLSAMRTLVDPVLPPLVVIIGRPLDSVLAPWRAEAAVQALVVAALALAVLGLTALSRRHIGALRASEAKLRGLFEMAPVGFALAPPDGAFLEANDSFMAVVGRDLEALRRCTDLDLTDPGDQPEAARQTAALRAGGRFGPYEKHYRHADGHRVPVRVRGLLIGGAGAGDDLVWTIVEDISAERAAADALAARTEELTRSNADLERFAYVASHDLREPLRTVTSFLGLLRRRLGSGLDGEAAEYMAHACDGATRMDQLICTLLDYSRIGRSDAPREPVALRVVADHVCRGLAMAIVEADARVDMPEQSPAVLGSRAEIVRLMQNLIGNAVKYRRPDSPVTVRLGWQVATDGMVHLTVADSGIGIAPADRDRVFEIFQRLHPRSAYEGTGIGLAVCKRIVETHGGRIWVDGNDMGGTTVHVCLPAAPAAEATAQRPPAPTASQR